MGRKVNPHGLRVGIYRDWDTKWYAEADFAKFLKEDHMIRKYVKAKLFADGIAKIEIERTPAKIKITIHTSKPGRVIGRAGAAIELLRLEIAKMIFKHNKAVYDIRIDIIEIKRAELNAQLVAESIAVQLEGRVAHRRAMKQAMNRTMKAQALGVKTAVSGILGGADMARTEHYHEGTIPLQTLRADIDYGFAEASTTFGKLGVKVWIYKGEILPEKARKGESIDVNAKKSKKA